MAFGQSPVVLGEDEIASSWLAQSSREIRNFGGVC